MNVLALLQSLATSGILASTGIHGAPPQGPGGPLHMWDWETPTVRVLGMEDGLSHASITAILQDQDGFLWVGTQDGLNRYDGHNFHVYRHVLDDSTTLVDDYVEALFEDESGTIWVGTNRAGLARLDESTGRVDAFPLGGLGSWSPEERPSPSARTVTGRSVWAITDDGAGRLVLGTDVGSTLFDPRRGEVDRLLGEVGDGTRALLRREDALWVGSDSGTLALYRRIDDGGWRPVTKVELGSAIFSISLDAAGRLWVGMTGGGVTIMEPGTLAEVTGHQIALPDDIGNVRHIYSDDELVWIGSTEGAWVVDLSTGGVSRLPFDPENARGLPDFEVRRVFRDRAETVWLGTWGGLASLPRLHRAFLRVPTSRELAGGLTQGAVSIARSDPGHLWIGTLGGGLNRLDLTTGSIEVFPEAEGTTGPSARVIFDLEPASMNRIWMATYGGGINLIHGEGSYFERFLPTSLTESSSTELNVNSVYVDSSRRVYAGTRQSGLQELVPGTNRFEPIQGPSGAADLGSEYVWPIVEGDDGSLWVGAHGGGLTRIGPDRASFRRWSTEDGLSDDRILTLLEDRDGRIWIGTEGGGLNRFDPADEEFRVYTTRDGLPHDNVEGLLQDDRGFLWISTNDGLARFDIETEDVWVFKESAGLAGNRFYANSAYKSGEGLLHFGGPDGLTIIDPSLVKRQDQPPRVALTALRIHERTTPMDRVRGEQGLELDYEDRFFTLSFAALDFNDPSQNRYQYRLDPLQEEWIDAGNDHVATYTSVPPNRYTFMVRARNSEGIWNEAGLRIPVVVATPWWQTWWFRSLVLAVVAGTVFALYSYRLQQMRSRQELRLRIAGRLHDDIGGNLSAMALKADLARTDEDKIDQYLSDISRLAGDAAHKVRETVWVVNTQYDTVSGLVSKMHDTLDIMLDGEVKTSFDAPEALPATPIGMELRQDVYMLYKELLQNVMKHARAGQVWVKIDYDAPTLTFTVRDDGVGFDLDDCEIGNGFSLMTARATKHRAHLNFDSAPNEGTTATLRVKMS